MKIVIIDCGFGNHGNIRAAINKIGINFSNKIQDLEIPKLKNKYMSLWNGTFNNMQAIGMDNKKGTWTNKKCEKVFRMAISLVLFFIKIVNPEIILKAATITINVRIINITFLSTFRALKSDLFKSDQV